MAILEERPLNSGYRVTKARNNSITNSASKVLTLLKSGVSSSVPFTSKKAKGPRHCSQKYGYTEIAVDGVCSSRQGLPQEPCS